MNPTDKETRSEMIAEIINGLSEAERLVYLAIYFDRYTWEGLKRLLGYAKPNYQNVGEDKP